MRETQPRDEEQIPAYRVNDGNEVHLFIAGIDALDFARDAGLGENSVAACYATRAEIERSTWSWR